VRQVILNRIRRQGISRPAARAGRLGIIAAQQACPYVVYRTPQADNGRNRSQAPDEDHEARQFVGSGTLVHRWLAPLNVQLLRPGQGSMRDREYQVPPFQAHELVQFLKDEMHGAGLDPHRLQGFRIADRLYLKETKVPSDRSFPRDPCRPKEIDAIIDNADHPVHHYLEIQLSSTGERVTTAFARTTVRGRSLSLDLAACALTRMPSDYEVLDKYREAGAGAVLRSALREILTIPASVGRHMAARRGSLGSSRRGVGQERPDLETPPPNHDRNPAEHPRGKQRQHGKTPRMTTPTSTTT
jgi:hypothetical protein